MDYVMGIDVGTGGVKLLVISADGTICTQATVSYSPDLPAPGYSEQDPQVWWSAVKEAMGAAVESFPDCRGKIKALACSGQMHSSVFLDERGEVIRKAILWNDARTTRQTKEIYDVVGRENLLRNAANLALEGFTLPKLLWLRANEPENYARLDKLIMPKDYINYRLTGRIVTDCSDAAGTLMYDVAKACWSEKILSALNIKKEILPEVLASSDIVGKVKGELCSLLGDDCLVIAGGADNSCAAVGSGMAHSGQGVISIGTSGTVIACMDGLKQSPDGEVHLFNYYRPDTIYAMGCMLSAGESLNWLKRTFFENISFSELDKLAEASDIGSRGIIFLPYLFGERTPHNDPYARGVFFGLTGAAGKGDIIRSVLEGVAFGIRDMYESVSKFADVRELTITGGGAKSGLWRQIIADVLDKELRINNISEGPALGAAFLAAVGSGAAADLEEIQSKMLSCTEIVSPTGKSKNYEPYYALYREIYKTNKELFKQLNML